MIQHFDNLTEQEVSKMLNAIPLIAILIAGADDKIDYNEKKWAVKLANIRTFSNPDELHDYYSKIGVDFSDRLNQFIDELPSNTASRQQNISERLAELNSVFPKLDPHFGAKLYDSCVSFAKHVANASGGFLGFGRVSKAESEWMTLPMLEPILLPEEEEEEGEE
ncbi:MAG: hypothetical protein AB8F94_22050 [Saprospiraceae bacterium]